MSTPDPDQQASTTSKPASKTVTQSSNRLVRWVFLVLGVLFFALGIVGAVLPVMPTAPFVLLAAACWARGSQRFYDWLVEHRWFGKFVRDWQEHRAVPRYAKWLAVLMMSASCSMLVYRLSGTTYAWMAWLVCVVCASVAVYLWRLPDA